jgi:hypothetical protein
MTTGAQDYAEAESAGRRLDRLMADRRARRKDAPSVPERIAVDLTPAVREALAYALDAWKRGGIALSRADFIRMAIVAAARRVAETEIVGAGFFTNNTNPKDPK